MGSRVAVMQNRLRVTWLIEALEHLKK
jgi:hypothetical protein